MSGKAMMKRAVVVVMVAVVILMVAQMAAASSHDGGSDEDVPSCLEACGTSVVSCFTNCYLNDVMNFMPCSSKCGLDNYKCMGACIATSIPTIPPLHSPYPPALS